MTQSLAKQVTLLYERFDPALVQALDQIYHPDVVFEDPMHQINGLPALQRYFSGLVEGLEECRFEFSDVLEKPASDEQQAQAVLLWVMHYRHHKLRGGKLLSLAGSSHLRFSDRIVYHRDYFDAGAMLYEHVPVLGSAIRLLKKRMEVQ